MINADENQFVENYIQYFLKYSFRVWNRTLKCGPHMNAYLYSQVTHSLGFKIPCEKPDRLTIHDERYTINESRSPIQILPRFPLRKAGRGF
jgi:hypothetical protein